MKGEAPLTQPGQTLEPEPPTRYITAHALVAQWIEHLTTDQKVGGSSPPERAN